MGRHEHRITHLQVVDCFFLEGVQLKRILLQQTISERAIITGPASEE
jgi:hypothetical protein